MVSDHLGCADGSRHGGTTYWLTVAPALRRAGADVTLAFLGRWHNAALDFEGREVTPIFFGRHKCDPRSFQDLAALIRQRCIEVLHLASWKGHFVGRIAARWIGIPALIQFHDTVRMPSVVRLLQRSLAGCTDGALAVSAATAAWAAGEYRLPASRIEVVHNGVELARYQRASPDARANLCRRLGIDPRAPIVGTMLLPRKGHQHAIRAMVEVLRAVPDAILIVSGTGKLRRELGTLADALGIARSVRFNGFDPQFVDLLAALDVIAMPALWGEGLPYAVVEAIAAGRPVVAYPVAGIPEILLHERTGLLVPIGDARALAQAMIRLLRDPELRARLGAAARADAHRFSLDAHVERLLCIYRAALGANERAD